MTFEELQALIELEVEESFRLEFKADLSSPEGPDPWYEGGRLGRNAKKALLKEVGAFANAQGGKILLGVAESSDNPPRASGLTPLPRPEDLRVVLQDLFRTVFEPAVPRTTVSVVSCSNDLGVLVIEVDPCPSGPIRDSHTKQCWRRTDTSSHEMSMKEIQDAALSKYFRASQIEQRIEQRASEFNKRVNLHAQGHEGVATGIRVSLIPASEIDPYDYVGETRNPMRFPFVRIGREQFQIPHNPLNRRKILRGNRWEHRGNIYLQIAEVYDTREIEAHFIFSKQPDEQKVYADWVLSLFGWAVEEYLYQGQAEANIQLPEYICDIEIYSVNAPTNWFSISPSSEPCTKQLDNPFRFPRYSFLSREEAHRAIELLCLDLYSICGRHKAPSGEISFSPN